MAELSTNSDWEVSVTARARVARVAAEAGSGTEASQMPRLVLNFDPLVLGWSYASGIRNC